MQSDESARIRRTLQVQLLLWAGFVILFYYIHSFNWMDDLWAYMPVIARSLWHVIFSKVLWAAGFLVLGYGVGRAVLDLTRISENLDTVADDIIFSIATGWGLIGLGAFFLGSLGLLNWILHVALAVILIAATHRQLIGFYRRVRSSWGNFDFTAVEWVLMATIFTIGLWGLGLCFLPEYGIDALNSHLPAPAKYLADGRISFHPEINFNNFPQTVEMWFMESMMLIPESAGALLMGICHLLTALAIFAMTRRFFGRGPGMIAALMYLLMKKVYRMATVAFIDQGLTLMLVLGMYAVIMYLENPKRSRALLTGLMFGFACGIKYSAFITVVLAAIVAIGYILWIRRDFLKFLLDFALAGLVLLLICSPWYIRNIVWFHNPFFPFYSDLFQTIGGTYAQYAADLRIDHRQMLHMFSPENARDPIAFILLPFTIAFKQFGPYDAEVGAIGPWTLIALPLVIFLKRWPKIIWAIFGLIFATFTWWWFVEGMIMLRYMLPIFSLAAVVSGFFLWDGLKLDRLEIRTAYGWFASAIIFATLVGFFMTVVTPDEVRRKMPLFPAKRNEFVRELFPAMPVINAMNEMFRDAEVSDRVRVYGYACEQYRWRADFTLIGNQVGYADFSDYMDHVGNPGELYQWLREYNIHYLIVNLPYAYLHSGEAAENALPSRYPGWETYFEEINTDYYVYVYRLK